MKTSTCPISTCRACRFYSPEGRRGGHCQQLGAPVSGRWKACSLGFPPFAPSWETIEGAVGWSPEASRLEEVMALEWTEETESLLASGAPRVSELVLTNAIDTHRRSN